MPNQTTENAKLRVAVFGTGYWAQFQIPAWQAIGAQVVAVWNRTRQKAEATAQKFGIPAVYDTPEQVFEQAAFDVADIIADAGAHEWLVTMAAQYRKAVICQKPMAETPEECARMTNACASTGIWYAIHENFRFQPQLRRTKEVLASGVIGRPLHADLRLKSPDRAIISMQPALAQKDHMALRDMGPHIFDVARFFFGEAKSIYSVPLRSYPDIPTDDSALSLLTMENGMLVSCALVHQYPHQLYVEGENGTLCLDTNHVITLRTGSGTQMIDTKTWQTPPYIPDVNVKVHGSHVFASIPACLQMLQSAYLSGIPAETSGTDNFKTMQLVFAAIRSQDEGRAILLTDQ